MKSLAELKQIRANLESAKSTPMEASTTKVVVGMGTCGIAAGARSVLLTIMEEMAQHNREDITISQTGCMGMCEKEPLLEVQSGNITTLYAYVTSDKARQIVLDHVLKGEPITDWAVTKK